MLRSSDDKASQGKPNLTELAAGAGATAYNAADLYNLCILAAECEHEQRSEGRVEQPTLLSPVWSSTELG